MPMRCAARGRVLNTPPARTESIRGAGAAVHGSEREARERAPTCFAAAGLGWVGLSGGAGFWAAADLRWRRWTRRWTGTGTAALRACARAGRWAVTVARGAVAGCVNEPNTNRRNERWWWGVVRGVQTEAPSERASERVGVWIGPLPAAFIHLHGQPGRMGRVSFGCISVSTCLCYKYTYRDLITRVCLVRRMFIRRE